MLLLSSTKSTSSVSVEVDEAITVTALKQQQQNKSRPSNNSSNRCAMRHRKNSSRTKADPETTAAIGVLCGSETTATEQAAPATVAIGRVMRH